MRAALALCVVFLLVLVIYSDAQSFTVNGGASANVPAGNDFATQSYGDAWDYDKRTDFAFMWSEGWVKDHPYISNGILAATARVNYPFVCPQWEGVVTSLNLDGRVGLRHPIDSSRYNRLSIRMRRSTARCNNMQFINIHSITPGEGVVGSVGSLCGFDQQSKRYINLGPSGSSQDWAIYKMDLDQVINVGGTWSMSPVLGLRFNPELLAGETVELDWMRLTPRGESTIRLAWSGIGGTVSLSATDGVSTINIYPDDGSQATTFADNRQFDFDYGFLPPGNWILRASGGGNNLQASLTIRPQPVLAVTRPSPEGGSSDFAQEIIGDPWDMKNPQDVQRNGGGFWEVVHATFGPDGMRGQYSGKDAPTAVFMDDGGERALTIDPAKYRHLTFTMEYDDDAKRLHWHNPNGAGMEWNLGVARVLYRLGGTGEWTTMEDIILVDGGAYTYHIDLGDATSRDSRSNLAAIDIGPHAWPDGPIGSFAIRIQECCIDAPCSSPPTFRLADVQLRNDERADSSGSFTVRWNAADVTADDRVNIYAELRPNTYSSVNLNARLTVVTGLAASAGAYAWDASSVPGGRYFIHIEAVDNTGRVLNRAVSLTPVALTGRYTKITTKPLAFYPLPSLVRLVDTRAGAKGALYSGENFLPAGSSRSWAIASTLYNDISIPANAVTLTGTLIVCGRSGGSADADGFVTLYPADTTRPLVATINPSKGLLQGNMFTTTLNGGAMAAFCSQDYNLIIDAAGCFAEADTSALFFAPITPFRILDTRPDPALYRGHGLVENASPLNIKAVGITYEGSSIPSNAVAVSGAFTVIPSGGGGYLTVWPGPQGSPMPLASVVNWSPDLNAEQSSISKVGSDGTVNIYALTPSHVLWDVDGYFSPDASLGFVPLASPVRFLDTRPEAAYISAQGPFTPGQERSYKVAGFEYNGLGLPDNAQAIVGTMTVVRTAAGPRIGYASIYPGTAPKRPLTAQMQIMPATMALSNAITVGLGTDGTVKIFALVDTHVILDIVGYYVPAQIAVARMEASASSSAAASSVSTSHSGNGAVVITLVVVASVIGLVLIALVATMMVYRSKALSGSGYQKTEF